MWRWAPICLPWGRFLLLGARCPSPGSDGVRAAQWRPCPGCGTRPARKSSRELQLPTAAHLRGARGPQSGGVAGGLSGRRGHSCQCARDAQPGTCQELSSSAASSPRAVLGTGSPGPCRGGAAPGEEPPAQAPFPVPGQGPVSRVTLWAFGRWHPSLGPLGGGFWSPNVPGGWAHRGPQVSAGACHAWPGAQLPPARASNLPFVL